MTDDFREAPVLSPEDEEYYRLLTFIIENVASQPVESFGPEALKLGWGKATA